MLRFVLLGFLINGTCGKKITMNHTDLGGSAGSLADKLIHSMVGQTPQTELANASFAKLASAEFRQHRLVLLRPQQHVNARRSAVSAVRDHIQPDLRTKVKNEMIMPSRLQIQNGSAKKISLVSGDMIGGLVLQDRLGVGGFGNAWRAKTETFGCNPGDIELKKGQTVALKLFNLNDGWTSLSNFEREADVLKRLSHPSIPRYYGSIARDRADGQEYGLVYSLTEGETLTTAVNSGQWRANATSMRTLAESLLELCSYLSSLETPVVHRDINPDNVILERGTQRAVLVDFGAAVLGGGIGSIAVGTDGFMAPESFSHIYTPSSDLYSVGATLLFAATGKAPNSFPQERLQIQFSDAIVGTIWERDESWLKELLDGLLAPAPEDRFNSASEALRFLRCDARGGSIYQPPLGSQLRVVRRGFELQVRFPPFDPDQSVRVVRGYDLAWASLMAVLTAGLLNSGAKDAATLSILFWGGGGYLLRRWLTPQLQDCTELQIGRFAWRYLRLEQSGVKVIFEGKTADLRCRARTNSIAEYVDKRLRTSRPIAGLVLNDGKIKRRLGETLRANEHRWLAGLISDHLHRCRGT